MFALRLFSRQNLFWALAFCCCAQLVSSPPGQSQNAIDPSKEALAVPIVDLQPPHFMRIEPDKDTGPDQTDYLDDILKANQNRVFRYKTMPVKIFIEPIGADFIQACLAGCQTWEERSHGLVHFLQVTEPAQARIKIEAVHQGVNPLPGNSAGAHTMMKWQYKTGPTLKNLPVVGLPVPALGRKFTVPPQIIEINLDVVTERVPEQQPILLRNMVMHELGHALGLIGHSPVHSDIMYKDTDEYSRLSQRDLNSLNRLYGMKVDVPL